MIFTNQLNHLSLITLSNIPIDIYDRQHKRDAINGEEKNIHFELTMNIIW